ncbi:sensor histidine kinase KdpD [Flavobacterium sp. 14A]|uniref:sensor histidine kinase n=1 Tax=Flavobacterium sp. 14A TaxID=2735896 RepID=UPI001570E60D|nr:HAMP domain-containing sensor histidine kinase [Flavobacterium sp. 14A]NRT10679.1 signal transduction histidine kinase [Flavobacterium sp. 14A]
MNIKQKWLDLIGTDKEFSLEKRIFHGVCLITSLVLLISFPANFSLGLLIFGYVLLVALILLLILFYFSRYKQQSRATFSIFAICISAILIIGYLFNCGINGPIILIFAITFIIYASIVKKEQLLFWMLFQLGIAYSLLFLEYWYPDMIYVHYDHPSFRYFDTALTLGILLLTIYLTIRYLKTNYRQQQELYIRKNEELQKANATKDKLFAIISHDLRSPFNALIGLSQILKEQQNELAEIEKEEFVNAIYDTSTKTYNLLQNLLEWSLSQTNEIQFSPQLISLKDFIPQALAMPLEVASSKQITINFNIFENHSIVADKNMMQTVLRNLVSNAIKFTAVGGKICISSLIDHEGTTLLISDNGLGMSEDTLKHLFDESGTHKSEEHIEERGTGLGLLLCRDFISKHDGHIWAESVQGKGSTFYVFLKKSCEKSNV